MPQRSSYQVVNTILADDGNYNLDYEVDLEGAALLGVFTVRGASTAFLATAPASALASQNEVVGEITPIADATSTELVNSTTGLLDGAVDAVVVSMDVDGGTYERFQDLTVPFRVVVESERLLVTAVVDGATEDTWTVIRGIDGTTAATHIDGSTVTQYIGPEANEFRVDDASAFAVNDIIKIETGGTERLLVTARNETTDIIAVSRGVWGSVIETVIADNAIVFDVIDDVKVFAAIAAANSDLRVAEPALTWPDGDTRDGRVALVAADYA
jgi:hypothetical protein